MKTVNDDRKGEIMGDEQRKTWYMSKKRMRENTKDLTFYIKILQKNRWHVDSAAEKKQNIVQRDAKIFRRIFGPFAVP